MRNIKCKRLRKCVFENECLGTSVKLVHEAEDSTELRKYVYKQMKKLKGFSNNTYPFYFLLPGYFASNYLYMQKRK